MNHQLKLFFNENYLNSLTQFIIKIIFLKKNFTIIPYHY